MLTYIITEAFETLDTAENSEATVEAQRTLTYTSEQGGGRSSITHIIVKGKVAEKNITYPVTWEFLWPDDNVVQLQTALSEIHNYVRPNNSPMENPSHNHKEVAVEVYDWLKVGWVEENRVGQGFIDFRKDSLTLRATVDNLNRLLSFRDVVMTTLGIRP